MGMIYLEISINIKIFRRFTRLLNNSNNGLINVLFINDIDLEINSKNYNTDILFGIDNIKSKVRNFYTKEFFQKCNFNGKNIYKYMTIHRDMRNI